MTDLCLSKGNKTSLKNIEFSVKPLKMLFLLFVIFLLKYEMVSVHLFILVLHVRLASCFPPFMFFMLILNLLLAVVSYLPNIQCSFAKT